MSDEIKLNPPESVETLEELKLYRTLYDDIVGNGVKLQYVDRHALGDLAVALVEARRLKRDLEYNGESYQSQGDRFMIERKNPSRAAYEKLRVYINQLYREFKMTPNSRKTTVGPSTGNTIDDDGFGAI